MDLKDPNDEIALGFTQSGALNALQLAAKLHELLLVACLGAVVMHFAQASMVGNRGLPLGMLTNAFSIGSGDYLRTSAYWSSIRTGKAHYWRFFLISMLATILATLAGPSAAISMIPQLNWFHISKPFVNDILPFYIFNQSSPLWPNEVTKQSINGPNSGVDCVTAAILTADQDICPQAGFRDTFQWAGNLLFTNSSAGTNISFASDRGDTRRVLSTQSCASDFDGRASGMSLNSAITTALDAYWTFARNNWEGLALKTGQPRIGLGGQIFAPKAEILCQGQDFGSVSEVENRKHVNFPSWTPEVELPSKNFITPYRGSFNDSTFDWVPMPAGPNNPSIGFVIRVPWEYSQLNDTSQNKTLFQGTEIHACSVYASWIPVEVYYEPRTSDFVTYKSKGQLTNTCLHIPHKSSDANQPIRNVSISQDYANAINQNISFTQGPTPAFEGMLQITVFQDDATDPNTGEILTTFKSPLPESAKTGVLIHTTEEEARKSRSTMIATLAAGVITDGLARVVGNGLFPFSASMFLTNETSPDGSAVGRFLVSSAQGGQDDPLNHTRADADQWLRLDIEYDRYGYGWSWSDSNTVKFGIIILLLHIAIAAAHAAFIIYKVCFKHEGLVGAWQTVAELLALALNSHPSPRLQDTCAGVEAAKTWRQLVSIRETNPGHLEMVIGPDKSRYPLPRAGQLYGHADFVEAEAEEVDEFYDAKER
jgi:hypothetical protein